jgi:hypothetical protein
MWSPDSTLKNGAVPTSLMSRKNKTNEIMKNKSIWVFLVFTLIFIECKKKLTPQLAELPDLSIVNISQESDWDYWVVGKKDYYYLKTENFLPKSVLFHSSEANKDYSIFFTDNGRIDKVAADGYIFIFRNFDGYKLDIGIIDPNGNIQITREIETDYNWDNLTLKSANLSVDWSDVIRFTGRVVGSVPCALSVSIR